MLDFDMHCIIDNKNEEIKSLNKAILQTESICDFEIDRDDQDIAAVLSQIQNMKKEIETRDIFIMDNLQFLDKK